LVTILQSHHRKLLWWGCLAIIIAGIFASGGRTAWLSFGAMSFVALFILPWGIGRLKYFNIGAFLAVSVLSAFIGLQSYKATIGAYVFEGRAQAMISMERPASGRLTVWQNTIPYIQDNLLWGIGLKNTHELNVEKAEGEYVRHIHNSVLEITLETGIIGLAIFVIVITLLIISFLRAYVHSTDRDLKMQSLAVFLSCLVFGIASLSLTSLFYTWWFLYLVMLVVLLKLSTLQLRK